MDMKKQLAAGRRQRAAKRQRSEVGTQRTEDRGQILLWERLSPP